jgi:hypothetical protein
MIWQTGKEGGVTKTASSKGQESSSQCGHTEDECTTRYCFPECFRMLLLLPLVPPLLSCRAAVASG